MKAPAIGREIKARIMKCLFLSLPMFTTVAASAGTLDQSLLKLDPEERAHQACIARGIDDLNRAKILTRVDRLKTSILSRAKFDGTNVVATGGAVRANHKWYRLKFTCGVTKDQMRATSFVYELGEEIPEARWEDLGLWK